MLSTDTKYPSHIEVLKYGFLLKSSRNFHARPALFIQSDLELFKECKSVDCYIVSDRLIKLYR